MLASTDIISLLEQNPGGLTSDEINALVGAKGRGIVGRLSKLHAYGLIGKRRIVSNQIGHGKSKWLPKAAT